MSTLTESSFVVTKMSVKWQCHNTYFFKTAKEFLAALREEFNYDFEEENYIHELLNREFNDLTDDDLDWMLIHCIDEKGYDIVYKGCSTGWVSVVRASDGKIWGEKGERRQH